MTGPEGNRMTGPKGTVNLFPENVNEIRVKQNSLFSKGLVIKWFVAYCSKTIQKQILINALRFQQQRQATSDHVQQQPTFRG